MSVRITDLMMSTAYLKNFNTIKNRQAELQNKLISSSKVNNPSDSPSGAAKILRLNKSLSQSETYINNIQNSLSFIQQTESSLQYMQGQITDVRVLMAEVNNTVNEPLYDSYAQKIDLIINSILNEANREYDGRYLFGGTDISAKPYGYNGAGTAIEQKVPDVTGIHKVNLSPSVPQKINITGDELFGVIGANDIFNTLISIRDDLQSGIKPTQVDQDNLSSFGDQILNILSTVGNITNHLIDSEELLNNRILSTKDLLSKENDVDVVEAIIDLEQQDYMLQLAYKTSASILPRSLLDYL